MVKVTQIAREETGYCHYTGYSFSLGQVRSECLMCTFRASYCSARLSWAQVLAFTGTGNKGGGGGVCVRLHWRVQAFCLAEKYVLYAYSHTGQHIPLPICISNDYQTLICF